MSERPKRERGYKDVTDPEELKRKLAQWQQRQLTLQGRKNKLDALLEKIEKQLKRTTTYAERIGRTLSLYKTYNHCWYATDRNYQNMCFLQEFIGEKEGEEEVGPEKAICYMFYVRTLSRGKLAFKRVEDEVIRMVHLDPHDKGFKYFRCTKIIQPVRQLGTIVPDLELLTVFGNRELPRLLEVLQAIPDKDWPIIEQRYSHNSSTERNFFIHPEYGLCEILIHTDD